VHWPSRSSLAIRAVFLLILGVQLILAANTDFSGAPRDTPSSSSAFMPLAPPLHHSLSLLGPYLSQPSFGILRHLWAPAIHWGAPIPSAFGRWLAELGRVHPVALLGLIATVNAISWFLLLLVLLFIARRVWPRPVATVAI
jgi:hypothetical protein